MELRSVAAKRFKNTDHRDGTEALRCCNPAYAITVHFKTEIF